MLHDIDKSGHKRRLNPAPNSNDQVIDRLAHGTTQNHNAGEEALVDGLKFKERQIIAKQDGFNKAIFGFLEDTNKFGLKVAKDDFDVLTATNDQLIFNSEQNTFKIVVKGTHTVTKAANSQAQDDTIDISAYNIEGPSLVVATILEGNFYYTLPYHVINESGVTNGGRVSATYRAYTNVGFLGLEIRTPNYTGNTLYTSEIVGNFTYYILQETAN